MKIFDCFTFFNEFDLLEFRLKYLDPVVDHFVIAESNLTHSGQPKPYYFRESKERFSRWSNKIIYCPVEQTAEGLVFEEQTRYNPKSAAWHLENEQRNALLQATEKMSAADLVLLSDLDEIPSRKSIRNVLHTKEPIAFSMLFHYYYLNGQSSGESRWWKGTIAAPAALFRDITPQGLRDKRDVYPSIPRAGWHFSYLGGAEKIREKLLATAHTEYNKDTFTDTEKIRIALDRGDDILGREGVRFRYMPLSFYPSALQKIMKEYPGLLYRSRSGLASTIYYTIRRILKNDY